MADEKVRVCWIEGGFYHTNIIINKIKLMVGTHELFIFDDDNQAEEIEAQILGNDFFSSTRIVILKALPDFKGTSKSNQRWIELFDKIPEECVVVIKGIAEKDYPTLYKHVEKIGKVFDPPSHLKREEAIGLIADTFEENKKNVAREDCELIADAVGVEYGKGVDVDKIMMTIHKICYYVGNRKKNIEHVDIRKALINYNNFVIWDVFKALDDKDYAQCQVLLYQSAEASSAKTAVEDLMYMMLWRYRLFLFLNESKVLGVNPKTISEQIKNIHKFKRDGSGLSATFEAEKDKDGNLKPLYSDYVVNTVLNGSYGKPSPLTKYTRTEIFKLSKVVEECLLKIRNGIKSDVDYLQIADNFFMFACKKFDIADEQALSNLRRIINE